MVGVVRRLTAVMRPALLAASLVLLCCLPRPDALGHARCASAQVEIDPPGVSERDLICDAAATTESLLAQCGIVPKRTYRIRVQQGLTNAEGCKIFGNYRLSLGLASILPMADCAALAAAVHPDGHTSALRKIPVPVLYRSLVVHELTHAIVHQNMTAAPTLAAHEYISGVMQIASLPEEVRQTYLQSFDRAGEHTAEMLGELALSMDPTRFGAAAYLHFMKQGHGCAFVRRLLHEDGVLPGAP